MPEEQIKTPQEQLESLFQTACNELSSIAKMMCDVKKQARPTIMAEMNGWILILRRLADTTSKEGF